jgi:hypothetical protein
MNTKLKWGGVRRLRRGALVLGALGVAAGLALTTGGVAFAGVGAQPGDLELLTGTGGTVITSGALTSTPSWATTTACPTGFQASAAITEFTLTGTAGSLISATISSGLTAPFAGLFDGTMGALLNTPPVSISATSPGTAEFVVGCYSAAGLGGTVSQEQSLFITVAAGATTFTASSTPPAQTATTTTLTATPANPVASGATVNLSASVTAADSTTPAGTVQFEENGTDIGTAVAVNTGGTAAPATTSFTAPTTTSSVSESLTAVFTPTSVAYASSTGPYTLNVVNSSVQTAGAIPVDVTVPATGTLSVTVSTTAISLTTSGSTATGTLNTVSVSDTRNTLLGWSVSGQDTAFTGSGSAAGASIPGDDMGWAPTCPTLATGAVCGATVAAGTSPGLADAAQVLASAVPGGGTGSSSLSAALTLNIPTTALAGPYTSTLTITYLETGP